MGKLEQILSENCEVSSRGTAVSLKSIEDLLKLSSKYRIYYNKEDIQTLLKEARNVNNLAFDMLTKVSTNILLEVVQERYVNEVDKKDFLKLAIEILIDGQKTYIEKSIQQPYRVFIKNYLYKRLEREYDEVKILKLLSYGDISFPTKDVLSNDVLKDFLKNISTFPRGTAHTSQVLIEEYKKGNERAKILLIYTSFLMVYEKVAKIKKTTKTVCPLMDLWQEGIAILLNSIEKYNPTHPLKRSFVAYLDIALQKGLTNFLNLKFSFLKEKGFLINVWRGYTKLVSEYKENGLPLPNDEEIKLRLRITPQTLEMLKRGLSFDVESIEEMELASTQSIDDVINGLNDVQVMLYFKGRLSPYEYYLLHSLAFNDGSTTKIGRKLGIPRQLVNIMYSRIIKKIRKMNVKDNELCYRLDEETLRNINRYSTEPLDIELKLSYMFLKDFLSSHERRLLKVLAEKKYKDEDYVLAFVLGLSIEEYHDIRKSLMAILATLKTDLKSEFESFKEYMISRVNHYIYNIDYDYDISCLDDILEDSKLVGINKVYVLK